MKAMIAIVIALLWQQPHTLPPRIVDTAKMFGPDAVAKGSASLDEVARATGWQVAIKTVETLGGKPIREAALAGAESADAPHLFVLFSKGDRKFLALPSTGASTAFKPEAIKEIEGAIGSAFKAGRFDDGLADAIGRIRAVAASTPSGNEPIGVHDRAKLFSTDAVLRADDALRTFHRDSKWQVAVATIESLDGKNIKTRAETDATAAQVRGLFVLISKGDHQVEIVSSRSAESVFPRTMIEGIVAALKVDFNAGKFDQGLQDAVAAIRKAVPVATAATLTGPTAEGKATPPPAAPATNTESIMPVILVIGVGGLFLLWLLSRAFRGARQQQQPQQYQQPQYPAPGYAPPRPPVGTGQPGYGPPPGYGQPGYGPPPGYGQPGYAPPPRQGGGGGFVSGALGGLGGAIAGNILYDQFGRPHQGHVEGQSHPTGGGYVPPPVPPGQVEPPRETYDPNAGAGGSWDDPAPPPDQGGDWDAAPDQGGGTDWGAAPDQSGGGGDWGAAPDQGGGGTDWGTAPDQGGDGGDWGSAPDQPAPDPDPDQGGSW